MTPTEEPNIHKVNINGLKGEKMKAIQQQHGTLTPHLHQQKVQLDRKSIRKAPK